MADKYGNDPDWLDVVDSITCALLIPGAPGYTEAEIPQSVVEFGEVNPADQSLDGGVFSNDGFNHLAIAL